MSGKLEDKLCTVCNGFGRYQDGDSGTDEDGRCPNVIECDCSDSERLPEYRAKHTSPAPTQVSWSDVEPWYNENEQMLKDVGKFEGIKGIALEVWRAAKTE